MSDSTNVVLQRAYELIEADKLEQAQELLAPLLETDDENPSLWWVYSHALRDQSLGQLALDRVLELDPSYPGANELKSDVLDIQSSDPDFLQVDVDESVSAQDAMGGAIDDWDDIQPELEDAGESSGGRQGAVVLAIILFVVAAGIALVASGTIDISEILSGTLPTPVVEVIVVGPPTAATLESTAATTAEATAGAEVIPGPDDEAANPLSEFVGAVADSISDFDIDRGASAVRNTLLGRTIVIQVCAVPGREFNAKLNRVINAMVELADAFPEDTEAVAAGLLHCDNESASLRIIGVPVATVRQYLDEDIDGKEFQRAWQPLS